MSDNEEQREKLLGATPWRMNIEGIRNQLNGRINSEPLKVVMLRTQGIDIEMLNQFREVASKELPADARVKIMDAWECCPEEKIPEKMLESNDLSQQFDFVEAVRRSVVGNGEEMLIDVTSGTKVCSTPRPVPDRIALAQASSEAHAPRCRPASRMPLNRMGGALHHPP